MTAEDLLKTVRRGEEARAALVKSLGEEIEATSKALAALIAQRNNLDPQRAVRNGGRKPGDGGRAWGSVRASVLAAVEAGHGSIASVARASGLQYEAAAQAMLRMVRRGELLRRDRGVYSLPEVSR